jgi:hypothetical protein
MGVGNVSYEYQFSNYPTFPEKVYCFTDETYFTLTDLIDTIYHYRVRAKDDFGHTSPWSAIERSAQDSTPPSVPILMAEPPFTPGTTNVFDWHTSWDVGIGSVIYFYQVARSGNFAPSDIYLEYPTAETQLELTDLADGKTYYFRVRSIDGFGHESNWSTHVQSKQDASPPTVPVINDLPEYQPEGPVTLSWDPSKDKGIGTSHYEVLWYKEGPGTPSGMVIDVIGQSLTVADLDDGTWSFVVWAVDLFDHKGPWSSVNTTVDATPPTPPLFLDVPEYSNGTSITLTWSPATDEGSGISGYRVTYFREDHPSAKYHIELMDTHVTIFGLEDHTSYGYELRAYDRVGHQVFGHRIVVTADNFPPFPVQLEQYPPTYFNGTSFEFKWSEALDMGVGGMEYNIQWDYDHNHATVTVKESGWITDTSFNVTDLKERKYYALVFARDAFGHVSMPSEVHFIVDMTPPEVSFISSADYSYLYGILSPLASLEEANPSSYSVTYWSPFRKGYIVQDEPIADDGDFTFRWFTTEMPDGGYFIYLNVTDGAGHNGSANFTTVIRNAHLSVGPSDITFSDPVPEKGDKVTVYVTVRNTGDSSAYDMVVELFDNGVLVDSYDRVILGAHSVIVFPFEVTVDGKHEFTARASSDLHYTREMEWPSVLRAQEEGGSVSVGSPVAWIGMLAIILAVIAIALNVVGRRGKATPPERYDEDLQTEVASDWEETPDEEK